MAGFIAFLSSEAVRGALESFSYIVAIVGASTAVIIFWKNSSAESRDMERRIYKDMQDQMHRINELCFNHPELDAGWFRRDGVGVSLTPEQKVQLCILYDMITSLFEDAYLIYGVASAKQRQRQWGGWEEYIRDYVGRPDYKAWWLSFAGSFGARIYSQYDREFEDFMWSLFESRYSQQELSRDGCLQGSEAV